MDAWELWKAGRFSFYVNTVRVRDVVVHPSGVLFIHQREAQITGAHYHLCVAPSFLADNERELVQFDTLYPGPIPRSENKITYSHKRKHGKQFQPRLQPK